MINNKLIAGFFAHLLVCIITLSEPDYDDLSLILFTFLFGNLIGLLLILLNKQIIGAKVFIISSFVFVPIGLIGIMGGKDILEKNNYELLEKKVKNYKSYDTGQNKEQRSPRKI